MRLSYIVITRDGAGKAVVSNPALSATPSFYGKVRGVIAGASFQGSTDSGAAWNGTFGADTFNFTAPGNDTYAGACRLIFDDAAPAGAPQGGSYTCDMTANGATIGSTEIVLTINGAAQMVVTNPAKTPHVTYFGYVVGALEGGVFSGVSDSGRPWNGVFSGQGFTFTSSDPSGISGGNCRATPDFLNNAAAGSRKVRVLSSGRR